MPAFPSPAWSRADRRRRRNKYQRHYLDLKEKLRQAVKAAGELLARPHPRKCPCGMCLQGSKSDVAAVAQVCSVFEPLL